MPLFKIMLPSAAPYVLESVIQGSPFQQGLDFSPLLSPLLPPLFSQLLSPLLLPLLLPLLSYTSCPSYVLLRLLLILGLTRASHKYTHSVHTHVHKYPHHALK
jgi:hypothetical protein